MSRRCKESGDSRSDRDFSSLALLIGTEMQQQQTNQQVQGQVGQQGIATSEKADDSPSDVARRELVDWCERHGLPVPTDRRGPRR